MTKAYRAEVREHLKNCAGARFSAEALVIVLAGGRIGQSDWSVECDRIISLLDDDADYMRGFKDGLKANTRDALAAAKQAISERTCKAVPKEEDGGRVAVGQRICDQCGCYLGTNTMLNDRLGEWGRPHYCPYCGAKVVE